MYERGKVTEYAPKSQSCSYGFLRSGYWYKVKVHVDSGEARVYVNGYKAATLDTTVGTVGRGGVLLMNGYRRMLSFKDYEISF